MKVKDWILKLQNLDPESHLTFAYDASDVHFWPNGDVIGPYSNHEYDIDDVVSVSDLFAKKFDLFSPDHPCYVVFVLMFLLNFQQP